MRRHAPNETRGEVPRGAATHPGEGHPAGWAERAVWTDRMLECLRGGGPEGGRWYSLHDKVFAERTLQAGFARVARNGGAPGVDGMTVVRFGENLVVEIRRRRQAWESGTYRPQPIRRTWIPKPGTNEQRPLGIPTVRDRVVQAALLAGLDRIKEVLRQRTRRTNGESLTTIVARLNPILRGWFAYFRSAVRPTHAQLDKLIRRRLRALLCKRHGWEMPSWGRGWHQQKWPKAFFAQLGLFSLEAASAGYCQAHRRAH